MEKVKLFMSNFALSLLVYITSIILAYLLLATMSHIGIPFTGRDSIPLWARIISWLSGLIFIALYFFLGTRLKSLGSNWLNYLSVCGISVLAMATMIPPPYLAIYAQLPLLNLTMIINRVIKDVYIVTIIFAILPSIIIWLGMLYKTKKSMRSA